jgi:chromosome segregation ATPase
MAYIDPVDDSHETVERAKAALRDIQRKRRAMEEERRRIRDEERNMKLHEEMLRRIIASGGNGSWGCAGMSTFHTSDIMSSS